MGDGVKACKMMDWGIRRKCNNLCGWLVVVELVFKTGHVIFKPAARELSANKLPVVVPRSCIDSSDTINCLFWSFVLL